MKLREILEKYKEEKIEIYKPKFKNNDSHSQNFHTDFIESIENYTGEERVICWSEMDKDRYNRTVLVNTSVRAEEFMDKNDKIVCILIEKEEKDKIMAILTPLQQLHKIENIIYTVPYDNLTPYLQGVRDMINLLNNEEQEDICLSDQICEALTSIEEINEEIPF